MRLDLIGTVLILIVATAPLAVLLSWLATRGHGGLGILAGSGQLDVWARLSMPWPRGVQEDDDVRWNFEPRGRPEDLSTIDVSAGAASEARVVDATRVRPSVHLR